MVRLSHIPVRSYLWPEVCEANVAYRRAMCTVPRNEKETAAFFVEDPWVVLVDGYEGLPDPIETATLTSCTHSSSRLGSIARSSQGRSPSRR